MDANKVFMLRRGELERRWDVNFYLPEFLHLEKLLQQRGAKKLSSFAVKVASGATPKKEDGEKYYSDADNGIPFVRVQNLSISGLLDLTDCKYINEETHNSLLERSQVSENDLLVKITGVGRMAVTSVPPKGFNGNINQHIVVVKTDSRSTSEILAAYLNTDIAETLASRRSTGGTRPALDFPALLSIPVLYDERFLAVMQAAHAAKRAKEAEARALLDSIDDYVLSELGITLPEERREMVFRVPFSRVRGGRLDPKNYLLSFQQRLSAVSSGSFEAQPLRKIITDSSSGDWGVDDEKRNEAIEYEYCLVIRATEFDNLYNLRLDNSRVKYRYITREKQQQMNVQAGDILIEKSGGSENQPVGRVALIEPEMCTQHQLAYSNFIHKICPDSNQVHSLYLFSVLKTLHNSKFSDVMQSQTNGIRNLIMNEYLNLPIPLPPLDVQERIAAEARARRERAKALEREAAETLAAAKAEVERMILG